MALKPNTPAPRNKLGSTFTPMGQALFVSAPRASQFDENKQEASIVLSAEDHALFLKELDAKMDACEEKLVVDRTKAQYPFKEETDKEGNPTGNFLWKSKTSMKYPAKFYSADGKLFTPDSSFMVSNRSKIRLAVSIELISTSLYKGLVLRLNAIKILSSTPWEGANPFAETNDEGDFAYSPGAAQAQATEESDDDSEWN